MQETTRGHRQSTCKSRLQVHLSGGHWAEKLDAFLSFNNHQVLVGAGKVSHKQAVTHAQNEYKQFAAQRRAALEAEGEAYAVRMLGTDSTAGSALAELGEVAKRLTKKKGGRHAA
jgi:hypothetical protein